MKKKMFYSLLLIALVFITSCGTTIDDAIQYNYNIIAEETSIIEKINTLDNEFRTYDPLLIEPALDSALIQVKHSIGILEGIKEFDGTTEFKDQTLEFFKMFKSQLENEYTEMLKIYKLPESQYTEVEENRYNELILKIDVEYQAQFEKFSNTQKAFANKYGFTLTEN